MKTLEHLPVLEVIEGLKIEDNGSAAKAAKQPNLLPERAHSQPLMREFYDVEPGIAAAHQIARPIRLSRPDTQINHLSLFHRYRFALVTVLLAGSAAQRRYRCSGLRSLRLSSKPRHMPLAIVSRVVTVVARAVIVILRAHLSPDPVENDADNIGAHTL